MNEQRIIIPKGSDASRAVAVLTVMAKDGPVEVTAKPLKPKRSEQQNRYLWGVVYPAILKHLDGWDADDLHEYCLGEWSGWEVIEGLGRKRMKPIRRSSKLKTVEFMEFVAHIQRTMGERGIWIPDPNQESYEP